MTPAEIIGSMAWVGTAGTAVGLAVQLVKGYLEIDSPRAKIATAAVASTVLTLAYAIQGGVNLAAQPFDLLIAALVLTGTGAGIQGAMSSAITNKPLDPPTARVAAAVDLIRRTPPTTPAAEERPTPPTP